MYTPATQLDCLSHQVSLKVDWSSLDSQVVIKGLMGHNRDFSIKLIGVRISLASNSIKERIWIILHAVMVKS